MASMPETCPGSESDKPRILHGPLFSVVFAYPSVGGFFRRETTRVELDWLNLTSGTNFQDKNQSQTAPIVPNKTELSNSSIEEDTFALRLMQIGGRWWPSQALFARHSSAHDPWPYGHHYPPDLDIGYPSTGGVLVLRTLPLDMVPLYDVPNATPRKPQEWSRLSLCMTMDERCAVLRDFGAVEYGLVEACPDIPAHLEDGIATGRYYEELLTKMEDWEYLDRWLDGL